MRAPPLQWTSLEERRGDREEPSTDLAPVSLRGVEGRRLGGTKRALDSARAERRRLDASEHGDQTDPSWSRREVLRLTGAAAAMVGLGGCFRQPREPILPYAQVPPESAPGAALHHATGLSLDGFTLGVVVTSVDGRPMKIEGNALHPGSLGATGPIEQASLMDLYDSARARVARHRGVETAVAHFREHLVARAQREDDGAGLRFVVEATASPLLNSVAARVATRFPGAKFVVLSPFDAAQAGLRLAVGRDASAVIHAQKARAVVSLGADPLAVTPATLRLARGLVDGRAPGSMNRLFVAEPSPTLTGAFADHRLRATPRQLGELVQALAARVGAATGRASLAALGGTLTLPEAMTRWVKAAAAELVAQRGASLVLAGPELPAEVHALTWALNAALKNVGQTVELVEPLLGPAVPTEPLAELVREIDAGAVDTLVVTAWNPVVACPGGRELAAALGRVEHAFTAGLREDETSARCAWFAPAAHPLETWRDGRGPDGTASVLQPVLAPLFEGLVDPQELLLAFLPPDERGSPHDLLAREWAPHGDATRPFRERWAGWLADGVIPETAAKPLDAAVDEAAVLSAWSSTASSPPFALSAPDSSKGSDGPDGGLRRAQPERLESDGLELHLFPDRVLRDGRFAHNPWLRELPDSLTQLTWGNAALVSPDTAARLGLSTSRQARLFLAGATLDVPVLVLPGQADECLSLALGHGGGFGVDAGPLRSAASPWGRTGLRVEPLDAGAELAQAQLHGRMEGREPALERTVTALKPAELEGLRVDAVEPYGFTPPDPASPQWGMAIDLNRCIGCGACVVACQAENNIPSVGKAQVAKGRQMHWLRVDRYFMGSEVEPSFITQPVACVHCERAPCEYVCPVNATVHSDEGLNQMVYNRCVGTRYCSNNCPYKVRRFNYLDYSELGLVEQLARNPDVTVRGRGVIEKCTYCVQRIERSRIEARVSGKTLREVPVRTACQQACPTVAIAFGDLNDPASPVSLMKREGRHYELLHELGTRPRTVHLVRLKNPSLELG